MEILLVDQKGIGKVASKVSIVAALWVDLKGSLQVVNSAALMASSMELASEVLMAALMVVM